MAPSTRSKAAAASSAPPSSAKQPVSEPRPTRQTRRAAEQKAAPPDFPPTEDQESVDPVKKNAFPITRRSAPRASPDASTIFLPSEAGLEEIESPEGSPMLGNDSFFSPPKRKINRSLLEEAEDVEPFALQPAVPKDGDPSSETLELLEHLASPIQEQSFELYKSLILLNNGDQSGVMLKLQRNQMKSAFTRLKASQSDFIHQDQLFIDVMRFHRVLKDHQDQDFANRAYRAICKSNLVLLLSYLLGTPLAAEKAQEIIDKVATNFPWVFDFSAPTEDEDEVARQTDLAFSLRCCHLASLIHRETHEDPYVLATRVFCEDKVESRKAAKQAISQGPYKRLTSPQIPGLTNEQYQAHMKVLDSYLSEKKRDKTQSRMEADYPVEQLVHTLEKWTEATSEKLFAPRRPEVQSKEDKDSSTPTEVSHVKEVSHGDEEHRSSSLMVPQDDDEPEPEPEAEESEADSEEGQSIHRLDSLAGKSIVDASDDDDDDDSEMGEEVIRKPGVEATKSILYNDKDVDEDEVSVAHSTPARPASSQAALISNQQLHNRIMALDPGEIISSSRPNESAPPASSLPAVHHRSSTSKRPVPTVEPSADADSEADPFETNSVLDKNSDRIAAKRVRLSELPATAGPSRPLPPTAIPSKSRSGGSGDEQDDHVARKETQPHDLAILTQRAQASKGAIRLHKTRPPQKRIPWSDDDTWKLIEDIANYGCSWAVLENKGRYEVKRNQQQIRDKARNEKVRTMEARSLLWAGFDDVVLGYKEKQHLIKLGLNPDRKEEDFEIGADGKKMPTNVYLEP
ncbi:hypothetical protein PG985_010620 [Apiospora marii]|uniref:Myb-like domain-containing protein n=1 Tax=Apiospora marii TaxID=335849 RepID=A0ABR1T1F9_9PEZI